MTSSSTVLRSLIVYAVCVPLAIFIGYQLKDPMTYSTLAILSVVGFVLAFPLVVKWHYPLLLLSWGMPCTLLFIKGQPNLWLALGMMTLAISVLERALSRETRFIHVREIIWPLTALVVVVIVTAKLTGGFGLRSLGSDVYGGKKYIYLMAGVVSYFALTTRAIPPKRARLYVALFFLGGVSNVIGDLYPIAPGWMEFVFWFFPPTRVQVGPFQFGVTRLGGIAAAGLAVYSFMMARYGVRGIILSGRPLRWFFFTAGLAVNFLGGFRSGLIFALATFVLQFYLEGLHRTKLLPMFILAGTLACALVVPVASKLPFTFQRTLAFLPIELDPQAKMDAEGSSQWRKDMWTALLPQIPQYFFLGKGYSISMQDWQMMGMDSSFRATDASQQGLALSGDYHNGPLSVVIPFGVWGVITFSWFLIAGLRVAYRNYKYGDPELLTTNTYLFSHYLVMFLVFIFIGGGLSSDLARFVGILGLSIALNGGVRKPEPKVVPVEEPRRAPGGLLRPPRPSFQR